MKNNILIIIIVTLVAIGVIAAVIIAGLAKDNNNSSGTIPDWGGSSANSENSAHTESSAPSYDPPTESSSSDLPAYSELNESSSSDQSSVSAPSSSTVTSSETSDPSLSAADSIVATASSLIGVPFVMGGNDPDGFDNPGFIYYVLRENGFHGVSQSIAKQSEMGRQIEFYELKAGDLVFFYNEEGTAVGFGGIYIGNGEMIGCLTPTTREAGVMKANITTPYYQREFYCGVSLS